MSLGCLQFFMSKANIITCFVKPAPILNQITSVSKNIISLLGAQPSYFSFLVGFIVLPPITSMSANPKISTSKEPSQSFCHQSDQAPSSSALDLFCIFSDSNVISSSTIYQSYYPQITPSKHHFLHNVPLFKSLS